MDELVNQYFMLFKEKLEPRESYSVYSNINFNEYYETIRKYLVEIIRKNRQNVLTSSFIDSILFPPEDLPSTLEKLSSDDEDTFFGVIWDYFSKPYVDYITGNYKEYIPYMETPANDEVKKLNVEAIKGALLLIRKAGFNLQEHVITLTLIFGVLTECFIEQKLYLYHNYLENLLKNPYPYIEDIKLTDLYNKGNINKRLTSKRIMEILENSRKEII